MKKTGEKAKAAMAHALFIAIIALGLYFIIGSGVSLTGHAVLDAETSKTKLESALSSSAILSTLSASNLCVVINDPEQPLSLKATKSSTGWIVTETTGMCSGAMAEDIVVQFANYDSFSKIVDNPSPRNIAQGAIARDYEILKSKYVELGGNVICDATFKVKYCGVLSTMATPEQLIDGDMACCIDKLTRSQKKLLAEHLQDGAFEDEIGILEEPSGVAGMNMTTSIIILAVFIVVVLGIVVGVVMMKGHKPAKPKASVAKPGAASPSVGTPIMPARPVVSQPAAPDPVVELQQYVTGVMSNGYTPDEIRAHLLEIGWDEATADKVVTEAYAVVESALEGQQPN